MRGKRYIKLDDDKNFLKWSRPIEIIDKSRFLSGKLADAPKQNQSSKNNERKERDTTKQSSQSGDDLVSRLKKLKTLYEEGILTEEEYQTKKNDLVDQI